MADLNDEVVKCRVALDRLADAFTSIAADYKRSIDMQAEELETMRQANAEFNDAINEGRTNREFIGKGG